MSFAYILVNYNSTPQQPYTPLRNMSKKSTAHLDMVDMVPTVMLTCCNGASWKSRGDNDYDDNNDSNGAIAADWGETKAEATIAPDRGQQ